jgi:uncharacterized protein YbjT (DUF2867 family)
MSFIDPDDVAAVAVKALTEIGHEGQTYKLTSEDAYTAADLAALLSKVVERKVKIFEGDLDALRNALIANGAPGEHAPVMAKYCGMVAAGLYETTDTLGKVLGRAPARLARTESPCALSAPNVALSLVTLLLAVDRPMRLQGAYAT